METETAALVEALAQAREKFRRTPAVSITWTPAAYPKNQGFGAWLDFVWDRLQQNQVSVCDLEDLKTAFGGYGAWSWEFGEDDLAKAVAGHSRELFKITVTRLGRQLVSAAFSRGLLDAVGQIADLAALQGLGASLGLGAREAGVVLWALAQAGEARWLKPYYKFNHEAHADPRENLELSGYQLTDHGLAALNRPE